MLVVFLDFDGVLNRGAGPGEPALVARLNTIIARTGACIVVHSTWRWGRSVEQLRDVLQSWGVKGTVLDKCPCPMSYTQTKAGLWVGEDDWASFQAGVDSVDERCIAIQRWLNDHPEVERYVIFDDSSRLGHFVGTPEFLRTMMNVGLTEEHVRLALLRLAGEAGS